MTVYITIGIPASGKTTWARQFVADNPDSTIIVSRDDIRAAHGWRSGFNEQAVTRIHRAQMEAGFLEGLDVVVADTNINKSFRNKLIKFCHEHAQDVVLYKFPIALDEAILRDSKRTSHMVGPDVITKFYNDLTSQNMDVEAEYLPAPKFFPYRHGKGAEYREPCIVVDIDGTVARHAHRSPYDESKVLTDEPIDDVIDVVGALVDAYRLVFVSGRKDSCRDDTVLWINRHFGLVEGEDYDLHMRKHDDTRPDYMVKADIYDEHVIPNHNIRMVFDDRDQVVRHVRARGITVAQVSPGRF